MKNYFIKKDAKWLHSHGGDILRCLALVLVLWLVMYPEFSITADCCRIVDEDGEEIECEMSERELAIAVLEADGDEIVVKSKLLELISEWREENEIGKCKD